MFKRLIAWIKSCFAGSIAVSDQNRGKINVDIADKRAIIVSPHSAVTMEYEHYKTESKWCELYKITKNPPHEVETDGDLVIWAVYRIGPLHYSKYFGWA